MKMFLQLISLMLFKKFIRTEANVHPAIIKRKIIPSKEESTGRVKKTHSKNDDSTESSSSNEGILIKISENKRSKRSSEKKSKDESSMKDKRKPNPIIDKPSPLNNMSDIGSLHVTPVSKSKKDGSDKKPENPKKPTVPPLLPFSKKITKPLKDELEVDKKTSVSDRLEKNPISPKVVNKDLNLPTDSTYQVPTSNFLLRGLDKQIKISEKEVMDLEEGNKKLERMILDIKKLQVMNRNIINKYNSLNGKNDTGKPRDLFNIKVIEVSDDIKPPK